MNTLDIIKFRLLNGASQMQFFKIDNVELRNLISTG